MFKELKEINSRPSPFQFYTADELWTNEHTSKKMLEYHLNEAIDVSSRNKIFIERSVEWIVSRFGVDNKTEIADFGCGPGLYTTRLSERGAIVTGIVFVVYKFVRALITKPNLRYYVASVLKDVKNMYYRYHV